jgi:hypothetical protein
MFTKVFIAALVFMMVNAVFFGIGAVTVLSIPALNENAPFLLPVVIGLSVVLAIPVAWMIAPRLRLRFWRARPVERQPLNETASPPTPV